MPSNRLRAVVADDHKEWRYILARLLEPEYDVIGYAERGEQAIAMASGLLPDIVTLDVSMPGQSGFDALPALRAALPDAIIIMVSTIDSPLYRREAFARGADDYVSKDRVLTDLLPAISSALHRSIERKQRRA